MVGLYIKDVLVPSKTQWFLEQIHAALSRQQMLVAEYELSAHDVLGLPTDEPVEAIWFEGRISALEQRYDGERAVIWVASNITASKQLQQQLQLQAMTDELTGAHNRRRFMQVLEQAYERFKHQAQPACLVSLDVDNFKAINDGLGHLAGDQALCDLAVAIQQITLADDWVCRLGGDEFAILCQGRTVAEMAAFAQQLLRCGYETLQPYATPGSTPALSVGLTHFTQADTSVEDIMRRVDKVLYLSKVKGGHQLTATEGCIA